MRYTIPLYQVQLVKDRKALKRPDHMLDAPRAVSLLMIELLGNPDREHFVVFMLDTRNKFIGANVVTVGTLTASLIHPREVFKPAILSNAAAVILAHNHPSDDTNPSAEDKETTKRLEQAGRLLGIGVLDHVIIGSGGAFASMRQLGHIGS